MRPALCLASLLLAGCIAGGDSDPSVRWDIDPPPAGVSGRHAHVFLPSLLRRPALVTRQPRAEAVIHDLDRWGTPLEEALERDIGALLASAPVRDVTVRVRRLDVSLQGDLHLDFDAEFILTGGDAERVTTLRTSGSVIEAGKAAVGGSLAVAVAAYGRVPSAIARSVLESVAQAQGGVAKPAATVTVPGK